MNRITIFNRIPVLEGVEEFNVCNFHKRLSKQLDNTRNSVKTNNLFVVMTRHYSRLCLCCRGNRALLADVDSVEKLTDVLVPDLGRLLNEGG